MLETTTSLPPLLTEESSESTSASTLSSSTNESAFNSTTNSTEGNETTGNDTAEKDYDEADSENIQENSEQTQEELEEEFGKGQGSNKTTIRVFADPVTNEPIIHNGHIALIFASTLIILSVLAYVGLILWRSRLESRYGMRQRLVTEDDYYNNNDVRYFGL